MKGIILAGGTGSRLHPLTLVTNKHLLPVGNLPMILHSVSKLVKVGIQEIMVVTGTEHMGDIVSLLGSGKKHECNFTFKVQDQPDGIAGALKLCKNFANNHDVVVILGDNIFETDLQKSVSMFENTKSKISLDTPLCLLNLTEVEDPERFGVATIKNDKIVKIVEKPQKPESNFCVTGIYIYDNKVFDYIKNLKHSKRGELEISDVNNFYVKEGVATYNILEGWWTDAGTHDSYHLANRLFSNR